MLGCGIYSNRILERYFVSVTRGIKKLLLSETIECFPLYPLMLFDRSLTEIVVRKLPIGSVFVENLLVEIDHRQLCTNVERGSSSFQSTMYVVSEK